jgi:hypothetical protein
MRYEGSTFLILRRMTMGAHDDPKLYDQRLESYLPTEATCALLQQILKSPDRLRKLLFKFNRLLEPDLRNSLEVETHILLNLLLA